MITLFTTAKSFYGSARWRQYNALKSWKQIHPDVEILLMGEGEGYEEAAHDLGLVRICDVEMSDKGCPRIDSMFTLVEKRAKHRLRAYLNCDIILTHDFLPALQRIPFDRFLAVSQRWNLAVEGPIGVTRDALQALRLRLTSEGKQSSQNAIDVFAYQGDIWTGLPPLFVGRAGYDNYLIYFARISGIPVVDTSEVTTLIHQLHNYDHLKDGWKDVWFSEEARANYQASGNVYAIFTVEHADWRMTARGLLRNRCRGKLNDYLISSYMVHSHCRDARAKGGRLFVSICEVYWRLRQWPGRLIFKLLKAPIWLCVIVLKGGSACTKAKQG